jgi:chemotaxis protein CheZ
MDAVENASELSNQMTTNIATLKSTWKKFNGKQNDAEEFKDFVSVMTEFFKQTEKNNSSINNDLTAILMAQGFQDLTGQVIKNIITLVHDVEESLVHTITMFGHMDEYTNALKSGKKIDKGVEGPVIDADKRDDVVNNQDDVDDLLSSLGF